MHRPDDDKPHRGEVCARLGLLRDTSGAPAAAGPLDRRHADRVWRGVRHGPPTCQQSAGQQALVKDYNGLGQANVADWGRQMLQTEF